MVGRIVSSKAIKQFSTLMAMNESNRPAIWILGMVGWGSITLVQWNLITGIACGAAGFVAACLSIYSWVEKRRRKARELRDHGTTDHGPREKELKRKHHHRNWLVLWLVMGVLLLWVTALYAQPDENTVDGGTAAGTAVQAAALSRAVTNAWAVQVADDVRKLVYDFLSGFSWAGLFAAYLGVKGLRNFTPLGRSGGKIGTLLRLINLEAKALKQMSEQTNKTQ